MAYATVIRSVLANGCAYLLYEGEKAVYWYRSLWWSCLLCLLLCLSVPSAAAAQARRGGLAPPAPGNAVPAPERAPQPLSPNTRITLDQNGLSIDVQDQDLPAIVERIAALGHIAISHPEGIPNRRVTIRFSSLPVVDGLKRLFRIAEVPGYVLVMSRDATRVERMIFLAEEGAGGTARGPVRAPQMATAPPTAVPPVPAALAPPPVPQEEPRRGEAAPSGTVFDEIRSNAAARRLLSQMMHPNEQVRERAFEGLVRLVQEDEKQRALMEFLEPLMEDLGSADKATQDSAREEIRKLLTR